MLHNQETVEEYIERKMYISSHFKILEENWKNFEWNYIDILKKFVQIIIPILL